MAITSKYYVLAPSADNLNFMDFYLSYGHINMVGQEIQYSGTAKVDALYVSPGLTYDLAGLSGGLADRIYLTGNLADYTLSLSGSSNQNLQLTGVFNGLTETVIVPGGSAFNSENLIFANGTVNSNALYNSVKNSTDKPVPAGETSLAPAAPSAAAPGATLDATIKAFSVNPAGVGQEGETFATTKPGIKFIAQGAAGIDTVYVADGANVTFTNTGASVDLIYMRGYWSDYTKELLASNTQIKFTRTLDDGSVESVIVSAGSNVSYDRVIFRDGNITTFDAKTALLDVTKGLDATVPELGAAFKTDMVTPGLSPYITGATVPASNIAGSGDTLNITVEFDQAVVLAEGKTVKLTAIVGTSEITLTSAAGAIGGTTANSLVFSSAALPAGLVDADGIVIKANSLQIIGNDLIGANALAVRMDNPEMMLPDQTVDSVISVSSIAITSANGAVNGLLNAGDEVFVTVTMSDDVVVTNTPEITLKIGPKLVKAVYESGSENQLVFKYTIQPDHADGNGISIVANSLSIANGTIEGVAGGSAVLAHNAVNDNPEFLVDAFAPINTVESFGYAHETNTLVLIGTNFNTLLGNGETAATNIKGRLDWSKLSYDFDANNPAGSPDVTFSIDNIVSANVTSPNQLVIKLNDDWANSAAFESNVNFNLGGNLRDSVDVAAGFSVDNAGNVATMDAKNDAFNSAIYLGTVADINLNLIAGATMNNGKQYYYLDHSNDGASTGVDYVTHNQLDALFNSGADTIETAAAAGVDDARTIVIGDFTLILPTIDELLALYADPLPNPPTGWNTNPYWSASLGNVDTHALVALNTGSSFFTYDKGNAYVALEVIYTPAPL